VVKNSKPKLLVLDGQGVVFNSPIKSFLLSFAKTNNLDYRQVEDRWENGLRTLAWTGAIDDESLWKALAGKPVDIPQTMLALRSSYRPGPAADHVREWSGMLPVWLLSNHRSHWVLPQLDALGVRDAFRNLLVSDRTGFVKPEPAAFGQLLHSDLLPGEILIVDDQAHNVASAEEAGFSAIQATPGTPWVELVSSWCRRQPG